MDWTDRLKDWADDAADDGSVDGIFDEVGDFLGDRVDGSWTQDLVDAGTDGVIDRLDGMVSQPVDGVLPTSGGTLSPDAWTMHAGDVLPDGVEQMPAVEEPAVSFEADPEPSHFDEAVAAADGNLRPAIGNFPDDATASCRHDRRDLGRSSRRPDRGRQRP